MLNILNDNKSNQNIKKIFVSENKSIPTAIQKWEKQILAPGDDFIWKSIFHLLPRCNQNKWMQIFQFKILHRILPTNKKLYQFKIKQSNECDYCGQAEESLIHLFCECDITSGIWQDVLDWLGNQSIRTEYLTDIQIIFGDPKFDPVINRVLVTTIMIIFKNKVGGRPHRMAQVIASLKSQFKTGKN